MAKVCRHSRGRNAQRVPALFIGLVTDQHLFPVTGGFAIVAIVVIQNNDLDDHNLVIDNTNNRQDFLTGLDYPILSIFIFAGLTIFCKGHGCGPAQKLNLVPVDADDCRDDIGTA